MKTNFKPTSNDGEESVMDTTQINVNEIRFNRESREISIVYEETETFTNKQLDGLSWQALKKMVLENDGTWSNKADAVDFLTGL